LEEQMIGIGKKAPDWRSEAYHLGELKTLASSDFEGRWHILYWYPLDFTFVCPTEIRGFERLQAEFAADDVALIGASTDSFFSHHTWFADREIFPDPITHPVLADTSHSVSRAFGVLDEAAGTAFRATAIIDDRGLLRSFSVNDVQVGRSPAEALRTVQALLSGGLCGAGWTRGEDFAA
jgi:peroxiredoxin (alkyl hydroperoxide reductase subunit C)